MEEPMELAHYIRRHDGSVIEPPGLPEADWQKAMDEFEELYSNATRTLTEMASRIRQEIRNG